MVMESLPETLGIMDSVFFGLALYTAWQVMTCLQGCAQSPRFASVHYDKTAACCSYATSRGRLVQPDFQSLATLLRALGLRFFGDS